jgi:hypothetical protein
MTRVIVNKAAAVIRGCLAPVNRCDEHGVGSKHRRRHDSKCVFEGIAGQKNDLESGHEKSNPMQSDWPLAHLIFLPCDASQNAPGRLVSGSPDRRILGKRLVLICLALACLLAHPTSAAADEQTNVVRLAIDYGDGVEKHFTALAWREGMSVLDATKAAQEHPRGIKFQFRGSGETAFLTQIDDLKNEGRGRNWIYRVNGELAERSFAAIKLAAGDTVLWKFEKSR